MVFSGVRDVRVPENERLPNHHIDGDMLLNYATGALGQAASIVVATHLSVCPSCRAAVNAAEVVGGALLEDMDPEPLSQSGVSDAFARLDEVGVDVPHVRKCTDAQSAFGTRLPWPVMDCLPSDVRSVRWNWISPGVKYTELLKDADGARIGLMRAAPGAVITPHGHSGDELTMVLSGGYHDGAKAFRPGDVQAVNELTVHEPTVDPDGECLSLVMIDGPVKPTRLLARIFRHFTVF